MRTLLIYIPLSWPQISSKAFRSILELVSPTNIDQLRSIYGVEPKIYVSDLFPLDRNRNAAVEKALGNTYEADYILFLDADMIFPKGMIQNLLRTLNEFPEVGMVSGLYWRKAAPHYCVQGRYSPWSTSLDGAKQSLGEHGFIDERGQQCLYYTPLQDFHTIQSIDVAGCGCLLTRAEIFKLIERPYFGYTNEYTTQDATFQHSSEEMLMFAKLHKAGVKMLVDPSIRCGHIKETVIGCVEGE